MSGSLNGARIALVCSAAVAAIIALVLGQWVVTVVLGLGILVHGLGWVWLYRQRDKQGPA